MELNEISDMFLLYKYSMVQKQLNALHKEKKDIESEISDRAESLQQLYRRGKFKMEREVEE